MRTFRGCCAAALALALVGDTMYFASNRDAAAGMAIYRSHLAGEDWSEPEPVVRGIAGEPSLTADGRLLYFVHVLTDAEGSFGADIWYCERPGTQAGRRAAQTPRTVIRRRP